MVYHSKEKTGTIDFQYSATMQDKVRCHKMNTVLLYSVRSIISSPSK